jgi:hypothetical protein
MLSQDQYALHCHARMESLLCRYLSACFSFIKPDARHGYHFSRQVLIFHVTLSLLPANINDPSVIVFCRNRRFFFRFGFSVRYLDTVPNRNSRLLSAWLRTLPLVRKFRFRNLLKEKINLSAFKHIRYIQKYKQLYHLTTDVLLNTLEQIFPPPYSKNIRVLKLSRRSS